jgi:hypothetical protein
VPIAPPIIMKSQISKTGTTINNNNNHIFFAPINRVVDLLGLCTYIDNEIEEFHIFFDRG